MRQTDVMHVRLLALTAVLLFIAASCSSSTPVQTGERLPLDAKVPEAADVSDAEAEDEDNLFGIGSASQIQSLVVDCEAGSDLACDILFQVSEFSSEDEQIGVECGGRGENELLFCTEGIRVSDDGLWFDEDSPGLPAVVTACEGGDMTACDFLFFRSAVGSDFEIIGNTCAGLTEVALPDCRTQFPE